MVLVCPVTVAPVNVAALQKSSYFHLYSSFCLSVPVRLSVCLSRLLEVVDSQNLFNKSLFQKWLFQL